jgi:hypothetical protein
MYTTREALAYKGDLPAQQNPTGVTPQLLDLLAMQKVEADKKAAAQALALSAGKSNMPTVAQGIEQQALNSARGEIAQKLGLAGLAQQQAQQAPQGPAPQMPPSQGIAGAPSPLPDSYQEGGIVAFAGPTGSQVPTPPVEYDPNSFQGMAMQAQKDAAALKPEDAYSKGKEEYQTEIGQNLARDIENQKARIAGIQALYERQATERPSNFMRGLQLMGKNTHGIGLGGAFEGVSEGIDKANAGYTAQDIANQVTIDGLNAAMEKARQSNDIGRYGAAKTARDAILARQAEAKKELGPLAGYAIQADTAAQNREAEAKRAAAQNVTSLEVARIHAASANRPGETERMLAEYGRIKATNPDAAEEYMKSIERVKTGTKGETAQEKLAVQRQGLLGKDESYKMASMAYYNSKDPVKKQKAKDTMDAIERTYGIIDDSAPNTGIGTPPPGAVKKIGQ